MGKRHITPEEQARLDLIERFTDAASSLLSTEVDIFEQHKEELEHALRMSTMLRNPTAQSSGMANDARCCQFLSLRLEYGPVVSFCFVNFNQQAERPTCPPGYIFLRSLS